MLYDIVLNMFLPFLLIIIEGMNQIHVKHLKLNLGNYLIGWRLFFFIDFMKYVIVVLYHHFNIHKGCDDWCDIGILQKLRKKKE